MYEHPAKSLPIQKEVISEPQINATLLVNNILDGIKNAYSSWRGLSYRVCNLFK